MKIYIIPVMLFIAQFIHIGTEDTNYFNVPVLVLPTWMGYIASKLLFIFYIFTSLYSLYLFYKNKYQHDLIIIIFSATYFFLMFYSLFTYDDIFRYVGLFIFSLFIPLYIKYIFKECGYLNQLRVLKNTCLLILFVSTIFSIVNFVPGFRIMGFYSSPNVYGGTLIFIIAILFLYNDAKDNDNNVVHYFLVLIVFINVVLSGSRAGLVGVLLFLIFKINNLKINIFVSISILLLFSRFSIDFNFDRFLIILNGINDLSSSSGRGLVWEKTIEYIKDNSLVGLGMSSPINIIGAGNIHNSYLRIFLMVGIPLGILSITMFFSSIVLSISRNKYHNAAKIYLISLALICLGEDYLVGIGSSQFFSTLIILSILTTRFNKTYK